MNLGSNEGNRPFMKLFHVGSHNEKEVTSVRLSNKYP